MQLKKIIDELPVTLVCGNDQVDVVEMTDDSRGVTSGGMFIARRGIDADGHDYIDQAIQSGATIVLAETQYQIDVPVGVTLLTTQNTGQLVGVLARRLYGDPAKKIQLIGITGTNGKTTTCYMIRHLLNSLGKKCGMIGTVEIDDGTTCSPAKLTTPGSIQAIQLLNQMANNGCKVCVMEVSSHALDQGRVDELIFDSAIFTNLSGDHLDYHGIMEKYAKAKAHLFDLLKKGESPNKHESKISGYAIVNMDDPWHEVMLADKHFNTPPVLYGIADETKDSSSMCAKINNMTSNGIDLHLTTGCREVDLCLPLIGEHNVYNMLAAVAAVEVLGFDINHPDMIKAINTMPGIPGRLERVEVNEIPFAVLVDYAHTDDALANVLNALRPITSRRLHVLFGCGGDRDRSKRPRMAKVACELADMVVITSDNPRNEEAKRIIDDVLAGVPTDHKGKVWVESDRRKAIQKIISQASVGDVVLIAGKGHEDYQIVGTQRQPFDDRIEARAAMLNVINNTRSNQ